MFPLQRDGTLQPQNSLRALPLGDCFTSQGVQLNVKSSGAVWKGYKESVEAQKGSYHLLSTPVLILSLRRSSGVSYCHSPVTQV